jgi:hypothetical protein
MSNRKEMITFEVQRMTTEAYRNFSKKTKMNMGKKIAEISGSRLHYIACTATISLCTYQGF